MGYRIEYEDRTGKYEVRRVGNDIFPKIWIYISLFIIGITFFWPDGAGALRAFLIPGDDAVTVQAFQIMTEGLRGGENLGEAVFTFCRHVVHGS